MCMAIAFKMTECVQQRICIRCGIKLDHSSVETTQMIQKAFEDDSMSAAHMKVWYKCFKDGQESVEVIHILRTPENVECVLQVDYNLLITGCNQQRLATNSVRLELIWDSKNYHV